MGSPPFIFENLSPPFFFPPPQNFFFGSPPFLKNSKIGFPPLKRGGTLLWKAQSDMEERCGRCANDDLEKFGLADDVEASQQTDALVEVLEDVICID